MSMPISLMASTAQGCISGVGSIPALITSKRFPARWRKSPSAIWLLAEFWVHRNNTFCFLDLCSTILLPSRPLRHFHRLGRSARPQLVCELVWQIAPQDSLDRPLQVVLDPHELDILDPFVGLHERVTRPPVAVLGLAD